MAAIDMSMMTRRAMMTLEGESVISMPTRVLYLPRADAFRGRSSTKLQMNAAPTKLTHIRVFFHLHDKEWTHDSKWETKVHVIGLKVHFPHLKLMQPFDGKLRKILLIACVRSAGGKWNFFDQILFARRSAVFETNLWIVISFTQKISVFLLLLLRLLQQFTYFFPHQNTPKKNKN